MVESTAPFANIPNVTITANIAPYGTVSALTDGAGNYSLNVPPMNGIVVTPSRVGYTFTPPSATLDTTTITPVIQNFTAPHVNTYTISGTLSGAAFVGKTVTITAAPGLTFNSGVIAAVPLPYTISGCANGAYNVTLAYTPACPGITVAPAAGYAVTVNGANIVARDFAASAVGVPTVTAVSPATGADTGGTTVTITGTNFACVSAVNFGINPAGSFTVNSPTSITAVSPAGTGVVDVQVTNPAGTSAAVTADHYTYISTYSISGTVYNTDGISPIAGATITALSGPLHDDFRPGRRLHPARCAERYLHTLVFIHRPGFCSHDVLCRQQCQQDGHRFHRRHRLHHQRHRDPGRARPRRRHRLDRQPTAPPRPRTGPTRSTACPLAPTPSPPPSRATLSPPFRLP